MSMEPETETPAGTVPGGALPSEETPPGEASSGWAAAAEAPPDEGTSNEETPDFAPAGEESGEPGLSGVAAAEAPYEEAFDVEPVDEESADRSGEPDTDEVASDEAEAFPSEQPVPDEAPAASHFEPHARQGETGEPEVDAVLESMEGLEGVPVSEHVEAFEDAHRRLHEALLSAGEESAGDPDGQGP